MRAFLSQEKKYLSLVQLISGITISVMLPIDYRVYFKLLALWYSTCSRIRLAGLCILSFNYKRSDEYIKFTFFEKRGIKMKKLLKLLEEIMSLKIYILR